MASKPKFNPKITRVKLNPEQAVLSCSCYDGGQVFCFGNFGKVGGGCLDPGAFKLSAGFDNGHCLFAFSSGSS